jgi:hypothetical protein
VTALLSSRGTVDVPERLDALATVIELADGRLDAASLDEARGVLQRAASGCACPPTTPSSRWPARPAAASPRCSTPWRARTCRVRACAARRPRRRTPACGAAPTGPRACSSASACAAAPPRCSTRTRRSSTAWSVVDLPDFDSTERANRATADRLLQLVDLFVWVVDPQKYADGVLHEDYLRPLAGHADVTVFAFNQIDRIDRDQLAQCRSDLDRLLVQDGLGGARVVSTSARTGEGLPSCARCWRRLSRRGRRVRRRIAATSTG